MVHGHGGRHDALPMACGFGWDVFCWIGHRRFSRHWSITLIQAELLDAYGITLSADAIADHIQRYQVMLSARRQDPESLRRQYQSVDTIVLSIDGLQPEKGHETLYVVRELNLKRVWFAKPLISATNAEVQRLIAKAKEWAASLGKPVGLWVSGKQDAFVQGIAAEFPGVTHRYCENHFLRDAAKPVLEADSHAKVHTRRKVRGLRKSRAGGPKKHEHASAEPNPTINDPEATFAVRTELVNPKATEVDSASDLVLDYFTAVRVILNDDQGGPLDPPGLRMTDALHEVRDSIQRNLDTKKGGSQSTNSADLAACIDRGLDAVHDEQEPIREYVEDLKEIDATLDPKRGSCARRKEKFEALTGRFREKTDEIHQHFAAIMLSFLAGLFVGGPKFEDPRQSRSGTVVPLAQKPRAADPRPPPRGRSDCSGGTHTGPCFGCARFTPRAIRCRRSAAVSRGSTAIEPGRGGEPSQDHEEGAVQEEPSSSARRTGTQVSRIACILAVWRGVVK